MAEALPRLGVRRQCRKAVVRGAVSDPFMKADKEHSRSREGKRLGGTDTERTLTCYDKCIICVMDRWEMMSS